MKKLLLKVFKYIIALTTTFIVFLLAVNCFDKLLYRIIFFILVMILVILLTPKSNSEIDTLLSFDKKSTLGKVMYIFGGFLGWIFLCYILFFKIS